MKKSSVFNFSLFLLFVLPFTSFAEGPKMVFEENKNQWPVQVKFQADIVGGKLFLEQNTFTYLYKENVNLHRIIGPVKVKFHSFKVNFLNSNTDAVISGNNLFPDHVNYYRGQDPSKWAENVRLYGQVYYKDLYAYVDMRVYNVENNLKYDLLIHPGANTKNIKLNYTGTDGMRLENGHLFIHTSVYDLIEQKPYAYQEINGEKKQVTCSYVLRKNTVSFDLGEYDHSLPLIIDPTLIASTYTGSTGDNWGFTATYDNGGNIYAGGVALATGYPVSPGAWDQTFNGGQNGPGQIEPFDVAIIKFNPTGTQRIFATYLGGAENEQPHSMIVNSNNELYIVGRTNSIDFPVSDGTAIGTSVAYDKSANGGYDIFISKFNAAGNLLASTYVGGAGDDGVNGGVPCADWTNYSSDLKFNFSDDGRSEIILDNNSNVYVASCTRSSAATLPLVKAYDNTLGGVQDGYVFKMNSTLSSMIWSTYLGGSTSPAGVNAQNTGNDAAYGLKLDNFNNVYVTGGTNSTDFPLTAGHLHATYQGGSADGFISVFNSAGVLQRSTYLGTSAYDQSYLIEIDVSGDLYVFGQTAGNYPVTPGVYSNPNSGQFVHKIAGNLNSTVFSTVFGTGPASGVPNVNISPIAFLVDSCQTIYISGWGRCASGDYRHPSPASNSGMKITPNAYKSTTDGCDFYYAVFAPNAQSLLYATYFGENASASGQGDHVDGGTSRFDKRGLIYQASCASCGGTNGFRTTAGAWSKTNNSKNCNEAVVKMDFSLNPLAVAHATGPNNGCAPFKICFDNTGSSANNFIWDFGDGSSSFAPSPCYTYSIGGTYTVTLYAIDTIGVCGFIDTARVVIKVGAKPSIAATATNISCAPSGLGSATVTVTPNGATLPLSYKWLPSGGAAQTASGLAAGTYSVIVSDAIGCPDTATVTIKAPPVLTVTTSATLATCGLSNGSASATPAGGTPPYSYLWSPGGNTSPSLSGVATGTYSILVTDAKGCTSPKTVNVLQNNKDLFVKTFSLNPILCHGDHTGSATAMSSTTTTLTYAWSTTPVQTTQTATGLGAGTHTVVITNGTGCKGDTTITLLEPEALASTIYSSDAKCFGDHSGTATATTVGGTGPYTYHWVTTPVQTTATATGFAMGTYTVLVSDANKCPFTKSFTINQPAMALTVNTATSGSSCGSIGKGIITSNTSNGTPPYSYLWSNGQTSPTISNLLAGTYTLTVTDTNGCKQVSTTTLKPNLKPHADFSSVQNASCDGVYIKFKDASANAITWNWTFGNVGSSTLQNPTFIFPYNGTYTITLAVTNPPCMDTVSKPINITDRPDYFSMAETNVFTPNGDNVNNCFLPYLIAGPGADTLNLKACAELEVFDRWGVKMFESVGTDNCWTGNNRKNNKPAPDGTYFYIAKLGKTTSRGYVTLLRHK